MSKKEIDIAEALDKAMDAYGTARIFEKRLGKLELLRSIKELMGFIVPLGVGSAALTLGIKASLMPIVLIVAGAFSFIQSVVSLWSLIRHWDSNCKKYLECKLKNYALSEEFIEVYKRYDEDGAKYSERLEKLISKNAKQLSDDHEILDTISPKEKEYGNKEGTAQYMPFCDKCREKNKTTGGSNA